MKESSNMYDIPTTASTARIIPLTDDRARPLTADSQWEPEPGSVVLINGQYGSAWQRQFDDGLWRCARGGRPREWSYLLEKRNLVLVYDAAPRP